MTTSRAIIWLAVSTSEQAGDEKASLQAQEAALLDTAARRGWHVIDTIRLPGQSRRFYTYSEMCDAARSAGITDPLRMFEHWRQRQFDVLAAWHTDRLGREQSIMAEVIQRTIDAGAWVYTEQEGDIRDHNYRGVIALSGYSSATTVDAFSERRQFGMKRRVDRGLPAARVKWTHIPVRNERGEMIGLQVDETKRRLFEDVYDLVVNAQLPLFGMEVALAERGHPLRPRGAIYTMLYHPQTWGHITRHAAGGKEGKEAIGAWAYRREQPHPAAIIHWDAVPAVWTGEQAERMIAELDRRKALQGRGAHPRTTHWFTGLFYCAECGRMLALNGGSRRLRCQGRYLHPPVCTAFNTLPLTAAAAGLEGMIAVGLEHDQLPGLKDAPPDPAAQLDAITRERSAILDELDALIVTQSRAHPAARERYQARIDALGVQLDALDARRTALQASAAGRADRSADQRTALSELAALSSIWDAPPAFLNQLLRRFLGGQRIEIAPDGRWGLMPV